MNPFTPDDSRRLSNELNASLLDPTLMSKKFKDAFSSEEILAEPDLSHKIFKAMVVAGLIAEPPKGLCQTYVGLMSAYCGRKRLVCSDSCYWHSETEQKYEASVIRDYFGEGMTRASALEKEVRAGYSLASAFLPNANLRSIGPPGNFSGAHLLGANLAGAHLGYSSLDSANLSHANFERANLSDCALTDVKFFSTKLYNAKFRNNRFDGSQGLRKQNFRTFQWGWLPGYSVLEQYPEQCEPVYLALAAYFGKEAAFDDASWAAYRACVMRHRLLAKHLSLRHVASTFTAQTFLLVSPGSPNPQFQIQRKIYALWVVFLLTYLRSLIFKLVWGYGEKPFRVVLTALTAIIIYALAYWMFRALNDSTLTASLYFSLVTFTTLGYGDILPRQSFRLAAASEALVGILLCGLFLFCLGRRSVGRA